MSSIGRLLPVANASFWPILLKNSLPAARSIFGEGTRWSLAKGRASGIRDFRRSAFLAIGMTDANAEFFNTTVVASAMEWQEENKLVA
jgi:hypothetical protein